MDKAKPLLYILAVTIVVFVLLLAECYIMAIVFGAIGLLAALIASVDEAPHKDTQRKPQSRGNKNRRYGSSRWNGFSGPNDFPSDGCGGNGW